MESLTTATLSILFSQFSLFFKKRRSAATSPTLTSNRHFMPFLLKLLEKGLCADVVGWIN